MELYGTAALDDADDDTPCTDQPEGHQLNTKEYQSMAIQEGAAYWVAAVTFNKTTETDCRLLPGVGVDWHHTGGSFRDAFSCQGYPTDAGGVEWGFGIDGGDFLGDTHDPIGNTDPAFSCLDDDPVVDVSTDLDWLRFLWDLTTEGVLFADVVDAYGAAEPYDWDVEDARALLGYQLVNVSGYGNEWYTHDEPNGVHR